jgi:glycosyltransferase involved in cell wall biosynthesis
VVTELAAAQQRAGHEVHIFTRIGAGQKEYELIDGVHYHRCPFAFGNNLIQEMHSMSKSMANAFLGCENYSGRFDIIHGHDWHVVPALDEIKKSRDKRIIWTLHSSQYGRDGNQFHNGSAEAIHGIEWYGTYISNRLVTCTQRMRDEAKWIHKVPEEKIRVIYNGIHTNKFNSWVDSGQVKGRYKIGPMDPTILFVGRMTYQKGPDLLVEAISDVLKDYPHAKFVFVGDGDMKNHLINRAHQLGVSHATRFTGFLHENEKIDLLKSCDAVCVPSRNEPFGIIVLEAWAAEKPVIAIHGTGAGDIVWHDITGLKVYGYPNSIAWGVKNIFSNFEKARWMGKNGRHAAEKEFNWDKIAKETLNVYQEVV